MTTRIPKLYQQLKEHHDKITTGRVLAIDPSSGGSSDPGFAYYYAGTLAESGTIQCDGRLPVERRLRHIAESLAGKYQDRVDILVVEKIRGRKAPAQLQWSIGSIITAVAGRGDPTYTIPPLIELPITTWKRYAKQCTGYEKGDEADAIMIGFALIEETKEICS